VQQRIMDGVCPAGILLTEEDVENVAAAHAYPNIARWLMYFTPQRIVDYMTANCSTSTVGGNTVSGWLQFEDFGPYLGIDAFFLFTYIIIFVLGSMYRLFKDV
jgi:hypothetical protein